MSKNICILVLSVGRSGSSATAGMLHCLGVDMGVKFLEGDKNNLEGTYEDLAFVNLNRAILTEQASISEYAGMVRNKPLWGVKDPQLCLTIGHFMPYLLAAGIDVRIVHVKRNPEDAIASYNKSYYSGTKTAKGWYEATSRALALNLERFDGPVLEMDFEYILDDPIREAERLAHFVDIDDPKLIRAAANHIRSKEKKPPGWGSVALGVRISKFPEPDFFKSWTAMLTGGVESRDKVLMPVSHQPAHRAANKLATSFLATRCDSLLLVDDDMMFAGDMLNKFRYNRDTWDYDIVSGLATTRVDPPRPITMRLQDPQPEAPDLLKGDTFDLVKEFTDGDVLPVDATGLAFTLIKRHVLEAMIDEKYGLDYTYFFTYGRGLESDDISFCRNARALGFTLAVDTNIKLGHIGQRVFTYQDYEDERNDYQFDFEEMAPMLEYVASRNGRMAKKAEEILVTITGQKRPD